MAIGRPEIKCASKAGGGDALMILAMKSVRRRPEMPRQPASVRGVGSHGV